MKRGATIFLRAVLVLVGVGAFAALLWEPHVEGRNAHATLFEIYFHDPFLAYAYTASIPFFVGLQQAFKLLGQVGRDGTFPPSAVTALRTIRYCAMTIIGFVVGGEVCIMLGDSDDRAGGVFIGMLVVFASIVVATAMASMERSLRRALDSRA